MGDDPSPLLTLDMKISMIIFITFVRVFKNP